MGGKLHRISYEIVLVENGKVVYLRNIINKNDFNLYIKFLSTYNLSIFVFFLLPKFEGNHFLLTCKRGRRKEYICMDGLKMHAW